MGIDDIYSLIMLVMTLGLVLCCVQIWPFCDSQSCAPAETNLPILWLRWLFPVGISAEHPIDLFFVSSPFHVDEGTSKGSAHLFESM
jgi:hypothetical protein